MRWRMGRMGQEGRDGAQNVTIMKSLKCAVMGSTNLTIAPALCSPEHQKPAQSATARSICEDQNKFSGRAHGLTQKPHTSTNENIFFDFLPHIFNRPKCVNPSTVPRTSVTDRMPTKIKNKGLNPVYGRRVNSFVLVCSLSSHRHSYIPLIFDSRFIDS
jgi:hypothetical protein